MKKKIFTTVTCIMLMLVVTTIPTTAAESPLNTDIAEQTQIKEYSISTVAAASDNVYVSCSCKKGHTHSFSVNSSNIKPGEKSSRVKLLQSLLVRNGYSIGNAGMDGIYGSATQNAVKSFQKKYNLSQDGIVGKNTASKMSRVLIRSGIQCTQ